MQQSRAKYQRHLFEETRPVPAVRFPRDVQEPLRQALVQWLQAVRRGCARRPAMNKITADHLARRACVYIRQSTPEQVRHNLESKRRQYGLVDRARALGWQEIDVIDDDLGMSGSGIRRPGFERLLSAVCDKQVGAVFSIEASWLARTNREWHTLLEFCSIVGVLLIDAEAVYDPRLTNDRLLLGMKGTISEMEVASFRERAQAAILQKAQRGAWSDGFRLDTSKEPRTASRGIRMPGSGPPSI
jgi:DNA invertase Pin-like site-specific DNA recombinase